MGRNGFRQQAETGRKERLRSMETELKNVQMAGRISQMMMKQMMENTQGLQQDLGRALNLINELQYKILAIQNVSGLDLSKLNEVANVQRLKDFNEASDKEDLNGNFTVGDLVQQDSTVILTSVTENPDNNIFRSRLKLADCQVKDLIEGFMGRPAGAKIITTLNGVEHEIELLGVRNPPAKVESVPDQNLVMANPAVNTEPEANALAN